ncbi:hypothetical protein L1987_84292 [Smallanthus sonchifolius]|uniref:Uncharacterized protein n=1 Tax=Smallanthus sonchifolius TaxID=185202 RepID=A0ACB8YDN2_9ASTR|nr:hypothetical protein L1987_84292 [Smallanthus sonchifolius]
MSIQSMLSELIKILEIHPKLVLAKREDESPHDSDSHSFADTNRDHYNGDVADGRVFVLGRYFYQQGYPSVCRPCGSSAASILQKRIYQGVALIEKLKEHAAVLEAHPSDDLEIMDKMHYCMHVNKLSNELSLLKEENVRMMLPHWRKSCLRRRGKDWRCY